MRFMSFHRFLVAAPLIFFVLTLEAQAMTLHIDYLSTGQAPKLKLSINGSISKSIFTLQTGEEFGDESLVSLTADKASLISVSSEKPIAPAEGFVLRLHKDGRPIGFFFGSGDGKRKKYTLSLPVLDFANTSAKVLFFEETPKNTIFVLATSGNNQFDMTESVSNRGNVNFLYAGAKVFYLSKKIPQTGTISYFVSKKPTEQGIDGYRNQFIVAGPSKGIIHNIEFADATKSSRHTISIEKGKALKFTDKVETDKAIIEGSAVAAKKLVQILAKTISPLKSREPTATELKKLLSVAESSYRDALHYNGIIVGGSQLILKRYREWLLNPPAQLEASKYVVIKREDDHLVAFYEEGMLIDDEMLSTQILFAKFFVRVEIKKGAFVAASDFENSI